MGDSTSADQANIVRGARGLAMLYDDAICYRMRTIVDIPDALLAELDASAGRERLSRAEAVRRAIAEYVSKRAATMPDMAFGAWKGKKIDALSFVDRLRDEW